MKAEEIAQSYSLVDKYGAADISSVDAMKEYARLQIEKDRERVKYNVMTLDIGYVDLNSIDETPIILD